MTITASRCALLAIPVLLLSGCKKEEELTFQAYVDRNALFQLMKDEPKAELIDVVKASDGDLKAKIKEAVTVLYYLAYTEDIDTL